MGRIISPSLGSSRLSRRHGQRIGFAPNSPYLFSGASWSPASLSNLVQRFLDANPTYHASTLQSFPILSPEETGTVAVPRGQRCALFDGVNDFGTLGARLTTGSVLTICAWVKASPATTMMVAGEWSGSAFSSNFYFGLTASNTLRLTTYTSSTTVTSFSSGTITAGAWNHVAVTWDGITATFYVNGTSAGSVSHAGPMNTNNEPFTIGGALNGLYFAGSLRDVRTYSVVKNASQIAAIANQHLTPSTIDTAGLLAMYPMQAESGTIGYDVSGNGRHLTLANITQSTFHAVDSGVNWNYNNWRGYTLSGAVVIPASLATPAQDVAGNALGVAGPVAKPATVEVPCVTGDGSAVYCDLGSALIPAGTGFTASFWVNTPNETKAFISQGLGSDNFEIYVSGSQVFLYFGGSNRITLTPGFAFQNVWSLITVSRSGDLYTLSLTNVNGTASGTLTFAGSLLVNQNTRLLTDAFNSFSSGRICDLRITTGGVTTFFPLQAGPGTSNTNRDLHFVRSNGTSGVVANAIVNGTVSSIWANRCPFARDWSIENGGGIAANGAFIPGRIGSNLDAAGNTKTLVAGKHGNPYSRINRNRWSAPELGNIGITSSDAVAASTNVQAASVVDTQFARRKTDGSDRYFASRTALTGPDKTNAEGYVA